MGKKIYFTIGRTILAICLLAFAVLHFVYPAYAPGIEPMFTTIRFPLPGEIIWVYLSAMVLLVTGFTILVDRQTRFAATAAGATLLAFDLLVWVPRFIQSPVQLAGNWLKDLGCIGGCFVLAAALARGNGVAAAENPSAAQFASSTASQPS